MVGIPTVLADSCAGKRDGLQFESLIITVLLSFFIIFHLLSHLIISCFGPLYWRWQLRQSPARPGRMLVRDLKPLPAKLQSQTGGVTLWGRSWFRGDCTFQVAIVLSLRQTSIDLGFEAVKEAAGDVEFADIVEVRFCRIYIYIYIL